MNLSKVKGKTPRREADQQISLRSKEVRNQDSLGEILKSEREEKLMPFGEKKGGEGRRKVMWENSLSNKVTTE